MQERTQCKPNIHKKQPRQKKKVMEKCTMILILTKTPGAHEQIFSVKVGNEATHSSQEGEVGIACIDSCDHASEKYVTTQIQKTYQLKNG